MSHTCHAIDCGTEVKPEMLMCYRHWKMVPHDLQKMVWATYRPGQCDDQQPSAEYCDTAKRAVETVARLEGKIPDPKDPHLTLYDLFRPRTEDADAKG